MGASLAITKAATEFLNGGGEMGERMRAFDWSSTSLGSPHAWPQSLKTIVRVMLDSRFAMWMMWGRDGNFFCNDAYLPTVGLKRDWVLGARAHRVWEEIWGAIGPRIDHVLNTGQATWDEALQLFLRRNGFDEESFHTFSYSPVYDDANRVTGMLCVVVEVTERVLAERRLKLLRELAAVSMTPARTLAQAGQLMMDGVEDAPLDIPFAALYLMEEGRSETQLVALTQLPAAGVLPRALGPAQPDALFGTSPGRPIAGQRQALGSFWPGVVVHGPWGDTVKDALVLPLRGARQAKPFGYLVLGASTRLPLDGSYRDFLTLVADQFASQLADVQARLDAQKRAEALADLDRAKNLFFSNVSHELRTPLTLLLGPIDNLLSSDKLAPDVRGELALAQRNGTRLRKLVNSLLDFSRIEAGKVETHFRPTDLQTFTADLASVFRSAMEQAGLTLTVDVQPFAHTAYVDRDMWEKVVLNLLSNAFKFTFEGGVEVTLTSVGESAQLQVRDTGVGIAAAALPKIFDRFERVPGQRSRSQEGTGIGLALVKELVKLHGGTVSATSVVDQGTTITVTIPLGRAHLPHERVDDSEVPQAVAVAVDNTSLLDDVLRAGNSSFRKTERAQVPVPPDQREHILVVDDNADMRAYIQRLLQPNWHVRTAADGHEALAAIAQVIPDLVITDMMMPHLDGRGLIHHLRADPQTQRLPVIVLSAQAGDEARVTGLQGGADDYLVKPFSTLELLARIEVQLMRVRMRRAEELRHKRMADVFRHAPVGVAVLRGPEHVFEFVNAVYSRFVGGRPVVGMPVRQALPELAGQDLYEMLDRVYASGEVQLVRAREVYLLNPSTHLMDPHYFEFVCQPLPADGDSDTRIAVLCIEVTELINARNAAEAANRSKDEFIAVLGHELRNPLAPITTALHLMQLGAPDVAKREREIIERQAKHMTRLVDDLLDVSRISRGNLALYRTEVELSEVVVKALETSQPLIESKQQFLRVAVPLRGMLLSGDTTRLCQVVSNLVTNAAKFTGPGGSIALRAWTEGDDAVLAIRDSGIGMTAQEIDTVFESFVQARQEIHRPHGGLGLGLAIARNLARLHGGSISAASEGPGHGSEFTLRLPLLVRESATVSGPLDIVPLQAGGSSKRILVVDDNSDAAHSLAEVLRLCGHQVLLALDAPTALKIVASGQAVDVAVLDIGLPVMNGYELAERLRRSEEEEGRRMRIVALSGYGQERDMSQARQSGFDAYLVKPVDLDLLTRAIAGSESLA